MVEFKAPGRGRRGSLSDENKEVIIVEYKSGTKVGVLASRFKVSDAAIYNTIKAAGISKPKKIVKFGHKDDTGKEKIRTFRCQDAIDCGAEFKRMTKESTASCPKCGMGAYEIDEVKVMADDEE